MPTAKQVNTYDYRAAPGAPPTPANTVLAFNDHPIRESGEMISLTDMWKAAGSDPSRQPSNWLGSADAKRFIETLSFLEPGNSGVQAKRGGRGVGGSTFASWQIALAYAKYLSPEFHMWCNTVVRAHMEGRQPPSYDSDLVEMWRRDDGILRMLSHKVTDIQKLVALATNFDETVARIVDQRLASDPRRAVLDKVSVRQLLDEEHKVPTKGRRSLQRKVFLRLSAFCLENKIDAYRCAHSGTWLFDRNAASSFVRERCAGLIAEHIAKLNGQGLLNLRVVKS